MSQIDSNQTSTSSVPKPRFHFYSETELETFPDPEYLLDKHIEARAFTVFYGPSAVGKTFAVLDQALCIATGTPWHGLAVKQAPVIYVVGEGTFGIKKRVRAWKQQHPGSVAGGAFFVLSAVQLTNPPELQEFLREIKKLKTAPGLLVFDTLATCFVGGDENSAQDMGKVVAAVRQVQRETQAAVALVHHSGKPSQFGPPSERGSSALRSGADTMIRIDAPHNGPRIKVDKAKDDAAPPPLEFILKAVTVGNDAKGKPIVSCVLVPQSGIGTPASPSGGVTPENLAALEALSSCGPGDIAVQQWLVAFRTLTKLSPETLKRRRQWLEKNGFITLVRKGIYRITALGEGTVKPLSRQSNDKTILQPSSHPFRGDGHGGDNEDCAEQEERLDEEAEGYEWWIDDRSEDLIH